MSLYFTFFYFYQLKFGIFVAVLSYFPFLPLVFKSFFVRQFMLTRSQKGEIVECDLEIKKAFRRNNVETTRRKNGRWWRTGANLVESPHPLYGNHYSHTTPQFGDQSCELRHGLINMIERIQFHSLLLEDPMVHLRKFLRFTNTMRSLANVSDNIRLATFAFSLGGKAGDWLGDFPGISIITSDQCSLAFLTRFFPVEKSE